MKVDLSLDSDICRDISMKNWIEGYLSRLPTRDYHEELVEELVSIAKRAYFTTFNDDYDFESSGIGLERLERFPQEQVNPCLDVLLAHGGNWYLKSYISSYRQREQAVPA